MNEFQTPEMKYQLFSVRDILTTSPESETAETTSGKRTDGDGAIITPPDEFEDD